MTGVASPKAARTALPEAPFKGLTPYSESDAEIFFGRDSEREIIVANLMASRLTLLLGESGVGKSSVLHAGVVPDLRDLTRDSLVERGAPDFAPVVFSAWQDDPVAGLLDAVERSVEELLGSEGAPDPPPRTRRLAELLEAWTERLAADLFIILDQFEEYFVYHPGEDGEGTFASEFSRVLSREELRVNFLIAIREDALARVADRFKGRVPNLVGNYLRIDHLDSQAAREAILKPIEVFNRTADNPVRIDPELVDAVLDQLRPGQVVLDSAGRGSVDGGTAAAPAEDRIETSYLQLVMKRLWEEELRAGSRTLQVETLRHLGDAKRIVRSHLDEQMSALPPSEQEAAAEIFHHLVTPSGTKIAHTVSDLAEYLDRKPSEIASVVEELSRGGVVILRPVAPPPGQPGGPRYEIFHDKLAAAVLDWRARYRQAEEARNLAESLKDRERERQEAEQRAQEERRRARIFRWTTAVAGMFAVLAIFGGLVAYFAMRASISQREIAQSRQLATSAVLNLDNDPRLSVLLARKAVEIRPTAEAEDALRESLAKQGPYRPLIGHSKPLRDIDYSPNGKLVATASLDGTVRVWEAASGDQVACFSGGAGETSLEFSPDGRRLVMGALDGHARIWQWQVSKSPRCQGRRGLLKSLPVGKQPGATGSVQDVHFSQDGRRVLTADLAGGAVVWNVARGTPVSKPFSVPGVNTWAAEISPRGRRVVTAGEDGAVRVWRVSKPRAPLATLRGHRGQTIVRSTAFSPSGRRVVSAGYDGTARVWSVARRREIAVLRGHRDRVHSAAFRPDGRAVITSGDHGEVRIWNPSSGEQIGELRGHGHTVPAARFDRTGRNVATASWDKTARVWRVGSELGNPLEHPRPVRTTRFSPDGRLVVTAARDGIARVWSVQERRLVASLPGKSPLNGAAFSPDGRLVVTAARDGIARVWSVQERRLVASLPGKSPLNGAAFSPDGRLVVTAARDGIARVWSVRERRLVARLPGKSPLNGAAFSPDGRRVVTAGSGGTAHLWEISVLPGIKNPVSGGNPCGSRIPYVSCAHQPQHRAKRSRPLLGHHDPRLAVRTAEFSPDGDLIVTASEDGDAVVWNAKRLTPTSEFPLGHPTAATSATFTHPDGKFVVTASADHAGRVWKVANPSEPLLVFRGPASLSAADVQRSGRLVATAGEDGMVRIYECSACGPLESLKRLAASRVPGSLTREERRKYDL
jgi:WD40 repeat protein